MTSGQGQPAGTTAPSTTVGATTTAGAAARTVGALSAAALMLTGCVTLGEEQAAEEQATEDEAPEDPATEDEPAGPEGVEDAPDEDLDREPEEADEAEDAEEGGDGPAIEQDILAGYLDETDLAEGWSYHEEPVPYLTEVEPGEGMISYDFALDWSDYEVDETCREVLDDIEELTAIATGSAEAVVYDDGVGTIEIDIFTSDRGLDLVEPYGALPGACEELESADGDEAVLEDWGISGVGGFWAEEVFSDREVTSGLAVWDGDGVHVYMFLDQLEDKAAAAEYLEAQIEALEEIDFR